MEILKNFGFDPVMMVAQIINFLIIFYLLKRFLYKPVFEMLKKRKDVIEEGQMQAEQARLTLEKTLSEEKKILTKARDEAKIITEDAKKHAIGLAETINENAKIQNERLLAETKIQIENESKELEEKLSTKISVLASDILTTSLKGIFTEKDKRVFVNKALKSIKKID
jgi:F-type H+-transporting ATPase subunit b